MKQHRVLIVGVGSIGERHLRCFQQTNRATVSFCELDDELRQVIADRYGVSDAYADLDTALASRPESAVICAPAHLHVPISRRLAEAGVHLLCEKPLSTSLDGIDELSEIVDRSGVTFSVAYVLRFHPVAQAAKQVIAGGRFGRPLNLVLVTGQDFSFCRPAYRKIYYNDRRTGGGAIQDALTHMINIGEWIVGDVDRLAADAAHQKLDGVTVEDTVHIIARHGQVMASYAMNQYQSPNAMMFKFVCERGTAEFDMVGGGWRWQDDPNGSWHDEEVESFQRDDLFVRQAVAFLDAVEGVRPPQCSLAEGLQTLRVNLAALAAADNHRWETVLR